MSNKHLHLLQAIYRDSTSRQWMFELGGSR